MGAEAYTYWVPGEADPAHALARALREASSGGNELLMPNESATGSMIKGLAEMQTSDQPGFSDEDLDYYFGTTKPSLTAVMACEHVWDDIDRGSARYVVVYEDDSPAGVFFMGYSLD